MSDSNPLREVDPEGWEVIEARNRLVQHFIELVERSRRPSETFQQAAKRLLLEAPPLHPGDG